MAVDTTEPKPLASADDAFQILIDYSEYWLPNNGDLAMLAVTLQRIKERWPRAPIGVLSKAPLLLRGYIPEAEAITVHAAHPGGADACRATRCARLRQCGRTARHSVAAGQDLAAQKGSRCASPAAGRMPLCATGSHLRETYENV